MMINNFSFVAPTKTVRGQPEASRKGKVDCRRAKSLAEPASATIECSIVSMVNIDCRLGRFRLYIKVQSVYFLSLDNDETRPLLILILFADTMARAGRGDKKGPKLFHFGLPS